jgi:hypothetical protein
MIMIIQIMMIIQMAMEALLWRIIMILTSPRRRRVGLERIGIGTRVILLMLNSWRRKYPSKEGTKEGIQINLVTQHYLY